MVLDCVTECGFGCFIPRKNFLNYHLAILAIIAAFFGIMGCISFNNIMDSIRNAPWVEAEIVNQNDYMFGLSGYAVKETKNEVYSTLRYDDPECTYKFCDTCHKARSAVLGCLIVGLCFAFFTFVCSIKRTFVEKYEDAAMWKNLAIFTSIVCFAFGCAAYNTHRPCYLAIERTLDAEVVAFETASDKNLDWSFGYGDGAHEVLVAFIFAIYIFAFNFLIPVVAPVNKK
jgi:hypothetical protein